MPDLTSGPAGLAAELTAFMADYERAANSHEITRVLPMIAEDAVYWFTDGSHTGREAVAMAWRMLHEHLSD